MNTAVRSGTATPSGDPEQRSRTDVPGAPTAHARPAARAPHPRASNSTSNTDRAIHTNRILVGIRSAAGHQPLEYHASRPTPSPRPRNRPLKLEVRDCVGAVTADPCGVPLSRSWRVPSGCLSGAASHRFTYNSTQRQSVTASTARTMRSHGTSSKNFWTSRSMIQSYFQHRCLHTASAS